MLSSNLLARIKHMKNNTQLQRYKKLLKFLDQKFKEDITIPDIEQACHYSYRNINRIFEALHHETIGKYIKRQKLERAAQYLKHSEESISEIAYEIGFSDVAAFSKAFKKRFNCSPSAFRKSAHAIQQLQQSLTQTKEENRQPISFEVEQLPAFDMLALSYSGAYTDIKAIYKTWTQFVNYASKHDLIDEHSIFLAEILDDDEISEQIHCRYNVGIVLQRPLGFEPAALFTIKHIERQRYVKFLHQGSHESSIDTYQQIYSSWMLDIPYEMKDAPVLEFFLNDESSVATEDLLTEIYIPIE